MGKYKREVSVEQRRRQDCNSCCAKEEREGNCPERHEMKNRRVEVECVCQVNPVISCHRHDEMEHLGCEFPVVMAYVPWQQWGDLYDIECGLMQGTIFKDLNFIFCGERC
ncbi:MAG: spore coat associated protein CotJA [Lachnospiraceae bacterium]|nr:spore coat associated protein CotJA [Lachnospiraceae bacterium]